MRATTWVKCRAAIRIPKRSKRSDAYISPPLSVNIFFCLFVILETTHPQLIMDQSHPSVRVYHEPL